MAYGKTIKTNIHASIEPNGEIMNLKNKFKHLVSQAEYPLETIILYSSILRFFSEGVVTCFSSFTGP